MIRHPGLHHIALYRISLSCDKKQRPSEVCTFAHLFESKESQVERRVGCTGGYLNRRSMAESSKSRERQNSYFDGLNVSFVVVAELPTVDASPVRAKPSYAFSL
jgi:hypothetical protein